jgi:hypothetical protein
MRKEKQSGTFQTPILHQPQQHVIAERIADLSHHARKVWIGAWNIKSDRDDG